MFDASDIQTVDDAVLECAHFGERFSESWGRIKQFLEGVQTQTNNNARDEIHDCDVCENGTVRLPSFRADLYRYCPWCSRELSPV